MRLIDADALKQEIYRLIDHRIKWTLETNIWELSLTDIEKAIDSAPTIPIKNTTQADDGEIL